MDGYIFGQALEFIRKIHRLATVATRSSKARLRNEPLVGTLVKAQKRIPPPLLSQSLTKLQELCLTDGSGAFGILSL